MKKNVRDFLLEIDVEELPAGYVKEALEGLRSGFMTSCAQFDPVSIIPDLGTKNKLILYIEGIPEKIAETSQEIFGPPKRIAFDEKGNPTKQAIGFAKSQGVKVGDLKVKETSKGEYVFIDKRHEARDSKEILKNAIPGIIKNIYFPKKMRWDDSGLYFARPIESVTVLFGKENLDIKIGNVPQKKIKNTTPIKYLNQIRKKYSIDAEKRKEEIKSLILKEIKRLKGDRSIDKNLLGEVTFMVNSPRKAFTGQFDKKFLVLPSEVLKASMAKHQRIFPVSKNGRIINKFIAVIDGSGKSIRDVRRNYENILDAKLQDSLFFFDEDTKKPFSGNIAQLKDLIFQKDLGTMFEKIQRMRALCSFICEEISRPDLKDSVQKAAGLSKSDLVTHMVGEFPSLQGVMGKEYALRSGEKKEIAVAIGEHYLPQGVDDDLPVSLEGAILAISDKIDNLVGFCGMGIDSISGSFDPFGIRRNALGLIRIVKDNSFLRFKLDKLIQRAIELYGDKLGVAADRFQKRIFDYIKDRIEFLMGEVRPIELKKAVLASGDFDIFDIFKRFNILKSISSERYFLEAAKVTERTSNILKGAKRKKIGTVDKDLFNEDLEREAWKRYLEIKGVMQDLINKEDYKEATREYARTFFKILHDFFDKVLVNAEDDSLRLNRLAMMEAINRLYTDSVADLAMLPQIVVK